jgi:DNA-binding MurR/RpiR family transcriptional regulator
VATTRLATVAIVDIRSASWARQKCSVVLPYYSGAASELDSATSAVSMLHLLLKNVAARIGSRASQRWEVIARILQELKGE